MKPRPPLPEGPFLVVGLARSGLAAARLLRSEGHEVMAADRGLSPAADLPQEAADIAQAAADLERLGVEVGPEADAAAMLERARTLVKSPGVPAQAPVVQAACERGLTVVGELELAWRLLPNEFLAVTGTNGKTTTVELIGHVHRQAGLPVAVAGNVGVALSGLAGELAPEAVVVCEASSFQLEDAVAFAPEAAVLLNVTPDHLDRHGSFERYRAAKLRIFARQGEGDVAVLPADLDLSELGGQARRVCFGGDGEQGVSLRDGELRWQGEALMGAAEVRLRGAHNLQNAMAAAAVCLARGVPGEAVREGLRSFPGVRHRLEEVASAGGVLYVNDSKATNVASTLVALNAMASDGLPVQLILGGLGKGQDFAPLAPAVQRGCRAVYLIGQDAAEIGHALASTDVPVSDCGDLASALDQAREGAQAGDAVLLSPACASFDQFADFEARGERFRTLVEEGIRPAA